MFLLAITPFGYSVFGLLILSFFISYKWLKGDKKEKPGCFSLGLATLIAFSILMFPFIFSVGFFQSGNDYIKIAIIAFWVLLPGSYFYAKATNRTGSFWKFIWTITKYVIGAIFLALFCILYFGMFFYVYQVLFTNEQQDFQLWAGLICVFFTSVLSLIIFSLPIMENPVKEKSTFYDLKKALKKPEDVTRLDLAEQNLTAFPTEILQMPNIKYLDLSKNRISNIPLEIKKLSKLEELLLKNNPISVSDKVSMRKDFPKIKMQF
ncbi:MAG TPA: hypothetical protein VF677_12850 [Flavobacterium sp.]|jgi:hypothetical protein